MARERTLADLMNECINGCLIRGAERRAAEQVCRAQIARAGLIPSPTARIPGYDPEPVPADAPAEDAPAKRRKG